MIVVFGRNVNDVYFDGIRRFSHPTAPKLYDSRNGPMLELPGLVVSKYNRPRERVLFDEARDCNPFLHFFESLWMLAGRHDLAYMLKFAKNFADFSDDGEILHGAYGYRWFKHFGRDQIGEAIDILKRDAMSRQVVTQMWDAEVDLNRKGKDVPCNTTVMWKLRDGVLDMTVTNRSNDAIWGAYGANAVHFSYLHEYVAASIGVKVGVYYQVSNSLHIYPEFPVTKRVMANLPGYGACPYQTNEVAAYRLFSSGATKEEFDRDLVQFMQAVDHDFLSSDDDYETQFFAEVVGPMWRVYTAYKDGEKASALRLSKQIGASDWRLAVQQWLARRAKS